MILFLYCFLSILLLFWIAHPLLHRSIRGNQTVAQELTAERVRALQQALKELYASQGNEDAIQEDNKHIEDRLLLELARIYEEQGIDPTSPTREPEPAQEPDGSDPDQAESTETEELVCTACHAPVKSNYLFCPNCGASRKAA